MASTFVILGIICMLLFLFYSLVSEDCEHARQVFSQGATL